MMDKIRDIKRGRIDLTDFLIHFTRKTEKMTGFEVLKQIILDGYIKTGWSIRDGKRTVYGKHQAVCFTETPLYGFVDYANKRNDRASVDNYGIALTKENLYTRGARPVIYGVTGTDTKIIESDGTYKISGFSEEEQYRYVLTTNIEGYSDWTHEREWRWINYLERSSVEGIPLWSNLNTSFVYETIIIIVALKRERDELIELFREILNQLLMLEKTNLLRRLGFRNLHFTSILTLQEIDFKNNPNYRIDDAFNENNMTHLVECINELDEYNYNKPKN